MGFNIVAESAALPRYFQIKNQKEETIKKGFDKKKWQKRKMWLVPHPA